VWNIATFALGDDRRGLEAALARNAFAALVATSDDRTTSRGTARLSPRDNIIFEFGLFAGRLGRTRPFLLVPENVSSLKRPTDLLGVTVDTFPIRATKPARKNGLRESADAIADAVMRLGPIEASTDPALANELLVSASAQLAQLRTSASVKMSAARRDAWMRSVLAAVLEPFLTRSDDAYSEWSRPEPGSNVLRVIGATNLDGGHADHTWRRGCDLGIAGCPHLARVLGLVGNAERAVGGSPRRVAARLGLTRRCASSRSGRSRRARARDSEQPDRRRELLAQLERLETSTSTRGKYTMRGQAL